MEANPSHLGWDPEVDTPATVAVLGGGTLAVEAALYARFLGYAVMLFDAAKVGDELLAWGDQPMLDSAGNAACWQDVTTPLGLAALEAHHGQVSLPPLDQRPVTHREYVEQYLLPVARTDLLYDSVQIQSVVESISRHGCDTLDRCSLEERSEMLFRMLIRSPNRGEYTQLFDVVLDCLPRPPQRLGLASGGGLAVGELELRPSMLDGKLDLLRKHRPKVLGKHCVLFGNTLEACASAIELVQLSEEGTGTRCTWVIPKRLGTKGLVFPQRTPSEIVNTIIDKSQALVSRDEASLVSIPAWGIESMRLEQTTAPDSIWQLRLQSKAEETLDISGDVFINCASSKPVRPFAEQLKIDLISNEWSLTAEPHYYRLGDWQMSDMQQSTPTFERIRAAFALIGGRRELNLYATVKPSGR